MLEYGRRAKDALAGTALPAQGGCVLPACLPACACAMKRLGWAVLRRLLCSALPCCRDGLRCIYSDLGTVCIFFGHTAFYSFFI